jgi:sugar phosphate isomerase/epimerase
MSAIIGVTGVMLPELDIDEQLALCRELGVTHYTLRPREIGDDKRSQPYSNWGNHKFDLTPQRLLDEADALKRRLADAGVTPCGTVPNAHVTDDDAALQLHFDGAAAVGARCVRVMPRGYPKTPFDYDAMLTQTIRQYEHAASLAQRVGVKIVIETHASSLASGPALAWNIVRHFDPAVVGVIFDLPNFAREGGVHPTLAVSVLRPWIDHCHVGGCRRVVTRRDDRGFNVVDTRMCPLDESDLHIPTWLAVLRDAGVHVPLMIEDYTPDTSGAARLRDSVAKLRQALVPA